MKTILFLFCLAAGAAAAQDAHPILFASEKEFVELRDRCENDSLCRAGQERVLADADRILKLPPLTRVLKDGRLEAADEAVWRISHLAMAWWLAQNEKYVVRCAAELKAIAAFEDWNPADFRDTAALTLAAAIGYDWLYAKLDYGDRSEISRAILEKGIKAGMATPGWARSRASLAQIGHGGMLAGNIVLWDAYGREYGEKFLKSAVENLPKAMETLYSPNGGYAEGPERWRTGTAFAVLAVSALEHAFENDSGLAKVPGFDKTGDFPTLITGPTGLQFNFGDNSAVREPSCAAWWLAKRFNRPDWVAGYELDQFKAYAKSSEGRNKLFVFSLLWCFPVEGKVEIKVPAEWSGEGAVPITVQRSGTDPAKMIYAALKGGSPSVPGGQMDAGTFIFESQGVRWACDLGPEPKAPSDPAQSSPRWKLFRQGCFSHNVPVIAGLPQKADGTGKIFSFKTPDGSSEAVFDLSELYPTVASVWRKSRLGAEGLYEIRDLVKGPPAVKVRWQMLTRAEIEDNWKNTVILRDGKKRLQLTAEHNPKTVWKIIELAKPISENDSANPGFRLLTFEDYTSAEGELNFHVKFENLVPAR